MTRWMAAALGAMIAVAAPGAGADVKTGVDAWHRGDFKRAVDEWRPLAIAGDADAEFNLGQAYKLGRGVPLDPALARSWFLKAANQGHVQAADNYGLSLFENGQKAEAVPWLEKSAARGEPRAQLVFGTMLFNGDGVARDYPRAYALMSRAAQTRDPELAGVARSASETLAQMDGYISATDRQHGVELAQRLAADETAQRVAANDRTAVPVGPRPTPRASVSAPTAREAVGAASHPSPRTSPSPHPTQSPRPAPAAPAAHSAPGGGWRVQLGAFRDAGNAHALWSRVGGRVGGSPSYVAGGGVTRLQAGPFASRAAAQHACAAAAGGCTVIAP